MKITDQEREQLVNILTEGVVDYYPAARKLIERILGNPVESERGGMRTADTITRDDIRLLLAYAQETGDIRVATDCKGALAPSLGRKAAVGLLRERCASAFNRYTDVMARKSEVKP